MSDLSDIQSTFDSKIFQYACQDVLRIVSILSLDSLDVVKPNNKKNVSTTILEKLIFLWRFFYMVFIKGFTPAIFDILPYNVWKAITILVYIYRLVLLPFWLRFTGYGKYANWSDLGTKLPSKTDNNAESQPLQVDSLSKESNLSSVNFGDPNYEMFVANLIQKTTHLSPHSQSPGNPFVHAGFPGNFFDHLSGVFKILLAWKQPRFVVRGGFFHSVYGTFDYRYSLYDLRSGRDALSGLIGLGAEELAFGICTSDRLGLVTSLSKAMYGNDVSTLLTVNNNNNDQSEVKYPQLIGQLTDAGYPVRNHITQQTHVLNSDYFAQFVIVMIADFMEQGALVGGGEDLDICMFQFLRYHFYNDLIQFVKPYLRVVPPVWEKYMGKKSFEEPNRKEIITFKRIWVSAMKFFESDPVRKKFLVTDEDKKMLTIMVAKYPYLPEPHIALAYTDKKKRVDLAGKGLQLLEEWGMLTVKSSNKSGHFSMKEVLKLIQLLKS